MVKIQEIENVLKIARLLLQSQHETIEIQKKVIKDLKDKNKNLSDERTILLVKAINDAKVKKVKKK